DKAQFTIYRNGRKQDITATIGSHDREQQASADTESHGASPSAQTVLGLELKSGAKGAVVTDIDPESDAADKGVQAGDVIMKVGTHEVHAPQDVRRYVADAKSSGRDSVLLLIAGEQGDRFVTVKIA